MLPKYFPEENDKKNYDRLSITAKSFVYDKKDSNMSIIEN